MPRDFMVTLVVEHDFGVQEECRLIPPHVQQTPVLAAPEARVKFEV